MDCLFLSSIVFFLICTVCFFPATIYYSYKYKGWRGILLSLGLFALYPASFIIILTGVFVSIFLFDKHTDNRYYVIFATLALWLIVIFTPYCITLSAGIKSHNKELIKTALWGLATTGALTAAFLLFINSGISV